MQSQKRRFEILAVMVIAITAVGFLGVFTFGWPGGGMSGYGMMGGSYGGGMWGTTTTNGEPLTSEQAVEVAEQFIDSYGGSDLALAEVMVFDNHFYAQAAEVETDRYAYEFLIDRFSGRVSLEPGPNMMWNEKYGHMGGMMGFFRGTSSNDSMLLDEDEAVDVAQAYLDRYVPGLQVDEHAATFYGYYTLHTLRGGETVGMLSVNGNSGAVWLHSWHGVYLGEAIADVH